MKFNLTSLLILIILLKYASIPNELIGQNLVPNPSFEKTLPPYFLPKTFSQNDVEFESGISDWDTPHLSTPDLLHPGFSKIIHIGNPVDGNTMVGLFNRPRYFEDVQVELTSPLIMGRTYYVEFWLARSKSIFNPEVKNEEFISSNFGILFTNEAFDDRTSTKPITAKPQIHCPEKLWLTTKWEKISGLFYADKKYNFITIGQFRDTTEERPDVISGYVLLDNILVTELNSMDQIFHLSVPPKAGTVIPIDEIYFENNKAEIQELSIPVLEKLYQYLMQNQNIKIRINGHTNARGKKESNKLLSEKRAKEIYNYLIEKGIHPTRLSWKGYGENKPKYNNTSYEGRGKNRRVEFEIIE